MAATRTCPSCGAQNSDLSIFCAECGTSLNTTTSDATIAFQPVAGSGDWTTPANATETSPESWSAPTAVPTDSSQGWGATTAPDSNRGFVLGICAWVLIAIILGAYLWSGVLDSGLKDDIRDLMPWTGMITLV